MAAWDKTLPLDSEAASTGPSRIREMKTQVQTAMQVEHTFPGSDVNNPTVYHNIPYGNTASRPAAGYTNRWYYNTTTSTIQRDTGTVWEDITVVLSTVIAGGGVNFVPFGQATAPVGWTQANQDDRMLRVVNTAGGGTGGDWNPTMDAKAHSHTIASYSTSNVAHSISNINGMSSSNPYNILTGLAAHPELSHYHDPLVDYSHTHTWDSTWRPKYFDVIICSKD